MSEDFHLPGLCCPSCGRDADGQSPVEDERRFPIPGDICICLYCAAPAKFHSDDAGKLCLRELTEEEWTELPSEMLQEMAKAQRLVREAIKEAKRYAEKRDHKRVG